MIPLRRHYLVLWVIALPLVLATVDAHSEIQRHFLYQVAIPNATIDVDKMKQAGVAPSSPPPYTSSVFVVCDEDAFNRLSQLGMKILSKSGSVPFRWLRPNELAGSVAQNTPAPLLSPCQGYHDRTATESLLKNWARHYPDRCSLYKIGQSYWGAPILAMRISDNPQLDEDEPAVVFGGNIHSSELFTVEILLDLVEKLITGYHTDPEITRWVDSTEIWAIPIINPDGNDCVYSMDYRWRKNAHPYSASRPLHIGDGVDLNRNFPVGRSTNERTRDNPVSAYYYGPSGGSEPETQTMMALSERERPVMSITYHNSGGWVIVPYSSRIMIQPKPNWGRQFGEMMGVHMLVEESTLTFRVDTEMYPVAGVDQDYYYNAFGTLAYIVEASRHGPHPNLERWREPILRSIRPSWRFCLERTIQSPKVWGHVRDYATGGPIEAEVSIKGHLLRMDERWTSHPVTGRFDRLLPEPQTLTIVARAKGYMTAEETVEVGTGPVQLEFQLQRIEPPPAD
jgi:Zinc carboxypeptidase